MALFEVVEGKPLDGSELDALNAVLDKRIIVAAIFGDLVCILLVLIVVLILIVVYPSRDAAGGREGQTRVERELEEASDGDELESGVVVYGKVGEDTDGDVVAAVVVEGVCLADDLEVRPLWELVLSWDVKDGLFGGCPARGRGRGAVVVAVWQGGQRPTRAFPRRGHC